MTSLTYYIFHVPLLIAYFLFPIHMNRSNNPVLLSFLRSIQKLAVTEPKLRDLMSKTFAAAPDLIVPVFSKLGINLEPRDSEPWRNNMSFLTEVSLRHFCNLVLYYDFRMKFAARSFLR